jgi:hypothetical protein
MALWIDESPYAWDTISLTLGKTEFLFRCRIKGRFNAKLDQRRSIGKSGGSVTQRGRNGTDVEVTILLFRPEDLNNYEKILPLLQARSVNTKPQTISVVNHQLRLFGISKLYFNAATVPERATAKDVLVSTLSFIENLPPSDVKTTTSGKSGNLENRANEADKYMKANEITNPAEKLRSNVDDLESKLEPQFSQ